MEELILKLQKMGAIKVGEFEIKRDFFVPFQIDLSGVISHPQLAKELALHLFEKAASFSFDVVMGSPFLGSCFATYIAWEKELPLVVYRTGAKEMTHKIEGSYKSGQRCLVFHDLLISAAPILDLKDDLEEEGLEVRDVVSFIDWELGAKQKLKDRGIKPHSILTAREALTLLHDAGKVPGDLFKLCEDFYEK